LGKEKARAVSLLLDADQTKVHDAYREANNILIQVVNHEQETLGSIRFFIKNDAALEAFLRSQIKTFDDLRLPYDRELEQVYRNRCLKEKLNPQRILLTADELRAGKLFPVKTEKMQGPFDNRGFAALRRDMKDAPAYSLGRAESAIRNYIDGKRSILAIHNAAEAEAGAVGIKDVENYFRVLEKAGFVKIQQK
jgi:hypothetical protein